MAHIRRHPKNGRWQVRYRDPSGKERSRNFRRKVDADAFRATVEADKIRGQWLNPDLFRLPYADWWARWHAGRVNLRPSTHQRDTIYWRSLIEPSLGDIPIGRIQPDTLRAWIASLIDEGKAPATVRKAAQLVKASLEAAVDDGLIGSNPARKLPLPQIPPQEMQFANAEEIQHLAGSIDPRWRGMVILSAYTGMRIGEVAGLEVDQLNILGRRVTVTQQLSEYAGGIFVAPPKTAAARRTISLPQFVCTEMSRHLTHYPVGEDRFVFHASEGGPIRRSNWRRRVWLPAVAEAGLEGFRYHDLRHSHAAMLIAQGEHPKVIQSRLGHSKISTTLDTYGHLFDGLDQAAADRLDQRWATLSDESPVRRAN